MKIFIKNKTIAEFKRLWDEKRSKKAIKAISEINNESNKNKSILIKSLSRLSAKKSSFHGLASLSDLNTLWHVKLVWIIFICLNWSYWFYSTFNLNQSYKLFKVITSYSQQIDTRMDFPGKKKTISAFFPKCKLYKYLNNLFKKKAITICNLNPFYGDRKFMDATIARRGVNISKSSSLLKYTDLSNSIMKSIYEFIDETNGWNWPETPEDLYDLSFYQEEFVITCEFNGMKCSYEDFYAYHDYNYGNCFRFNGNDANRTNSSVFPDFVNYPIRKTKKPGWENGLRLELYTGDQSKLFSLKIYK